MQFNEKLVFLMNITQTSNKELAAGISVDPSLISLFRTGKRKQPQNPSHIKNMAAFFSKRCPAEFQRNALAEMMEQRSIRSSMPTEILAAHLEKWLTEDSNIVDRLLEGMEPLTPELQPSKNTNKILGSTKDASFYFGEEGRREVMQHMTKIILETESPRTLLISSDDNLEWLLSDYTLTQQIQSDMLKVIEKGFTFHQIMPAINFLSRFTEALQFWLPMYITGQVKVYYYPRLRDNLYRRSMIVLPKRCVRISSAIGLGSSSDVTMFSTDPEVVHAHTMQFQEHLSLCRPALSVHTGLEDFVRLFHDISFRKGDHINMAAPLSPNTLPRELLERLLSGITDPVLRPVFQAPLEQITQFEDMLRHRQYIDMAPLATPEDIRSGKVFIAFPYKACPKQPAYTPETYVLHLKNILRLMEQYENYYFVPYYETTPKNYNLIVNSDGLALLMRTSAPPLMLEIHRPELVMACQEHLLRKAENAGYADMHKRKIRLKIQALINELQS